MPVRIREGARALATAGECLIYVGHSVCADSCENANRLTSDEWVVWGARRSDGRHGDYG